MYSPSCCTSSINVVFLPSTSVDYLGLESLHDTSAGGNCTLRNALGNAFGFILVVVHHQHKGLQGRHGANQLAERAKRTDGIVTECEQSPAGQFCGSYR